MTDPEPDSHEAMPPRYDPGADLAPTEPVDPAVAAAATPPPEWRATSAPLAEVIAKPKATSGRGTSMLLVLAAAIAVGGIAFAAGRLTAPATAASADRSGNGQFPRGSFSPGNGQGFPGRGADVGGITVQGEVTAVSTDSITLKLASGTSITIPLDSATAYHKAAAATSADVAVGSNVKVSPGGRVANPSASLDPNATRPPGAGLSFGAATDVTVIEP